LRTPEKVLLWVGVKLEKWHKRATAGNDRPWGGAGETVLGISFEKKPVEKGPKNRRGQKTVRTGKKKSSPAGRVGGPDIASSKLIHSLAAKN